MCNQKGRTMSGRITRNLALLLLLVPALAAAAPKRPAKRPAQVDGVAALVDSVAILKSEVNDQTQILLQQPNLGVDAKNPAALLKLRNDVLDRMVEEKVIAAEAHRQNVQADQAEVDQQVEQALGSARRALGSEEAFQAQLKREGLDEGTLRKRYQGDFTTQLMARKLVQREVQSKVSADSNDARAYYEAHRAELPKRPLTYKLSAILFQVKPGEVLKAKMKDKALGVLARVKAGEDFSKMATLFSDDPSARNGGELPWFTRGQLDTSFEKAAFAMKPGQISDVVESRFGFHVIKLDSIAGDRIKTRHVLLMVVADSSDTAGTMARAAAVRSRAVAREDFAKLASQFSDDPVTAQNGGQLEPTDLSEGFSPDIAKVIKDMVPSQISNVLKSNSGLVIFRLNAKETERAYDYPEIAAQLENMAKGEKTKAEYDKWVAELKKKHRVKVTHFK